MNEEDLDLLSASGKGNHEAFRRLVEKNQNRVFHICLGFVRNSEEAEDLTQEVFFQIYKNATRFQGKSKVSTWIYRIAVNRSLNRLRQLRTNEWLQCFGASSLSYVASQIASPLEMPDMALERHERQEIVRKALRRLPSNLRIALTLQKVHGISNEQIADITGCSVSAVESRIHRAKSKLKKLLVQFAPESF